MLKHVSNTQIAMFLRCGHQYYKRYIMGIKNPPSASMVRGRCGHKTEEVNFRQKIETGEDIPVEEAQDIFSDQWQAGRFEIAWTKEELGDSTPKVMLGKYKDSGISLVSKFHEEQAPQCDPLAVEERLEVEFEGDFPKLVSIIDLRDKEGAINEFKFVSKSPTKDDAVYDLQLTIEDFVVRNATGQKPTKLIKRYAIDNKEPITAIQEVPPRDDETINRFLHRLHTSIESIRKGVFLPAPAGAWWCSPSFCGYWNTCKYHP